MMASAGMSTDPKKRLHPVNATMRAVNAMLYVVPLLFILFCFSPQSSRSFTEFLFFSIDVYRENKITPWCSVYSVVNNHSANLLKYFNSCSGSNEGWKILIKSFNTKSGWKGKSS